MVSKFTVLLRVIRCIVAFNSNFICYPASLFRCIVVNNSILMLYGVQCHCSVVCSKLYCSVQFQCHMVSKFTILFCLIRCTVVYNSIPILYGIEVHCSVVCSSLYCCNQFQCYIVSKFTVL